MSQQVQTVQQHGKVALEDVSVSYGQISALSDISLTVDEGGFVAVIGPNGAGKTTMADTIAGFLEYTGSVRIEGDEVRNMSTQELAKRKVTYCTEKRNLFSHMSVEENLEMGGYSGSVNINERLDYVYDVFPRLQERRDQLANTMSGGEQQMLTIGRGLMADPELMILDEPTIGLAPVIIEDINDAIDTIKEDEVTVLLFEQNVTFAFNHAEYLYVLENGSIHLDGRPSELEDDDYITEAYLGQ